MSWLKQNWFKVLIFALAVVAIASYFLDLPFLSKTADGPIGKEDKMLSSQKVEWVGEVITGMTYGRLLLKGLSGDGVPEEFVVEPKDIIESGVFHYSPMTQDIGAGQIIRVSGEKEMLPDEIPWVLVEKIEKL